MGGGADATASGEACLHGGREVQPHAKERPAGRGQDAERTRSAVLGVL